VPVFNHLFLPKKASSKPLIFRRPEALKSKVCKLSGTDVVSHITQYRLPYKKGINNHTCTCCICFGQELLDVLQEIYTRCLIVNRTPRNPYLVVWVAWEKKDQDFHQGLECSDKNGHVVGWVWYKCEIPTQATAPYDCQRMRRPSKK